MTHPLGGRGAAEDGGGETFLAREEWAKPRGRKSIRPPLRLRRSRRSRPSARSKPSRGPVARVRRPESCGEGVARHRTARTRGGGFSGQRKPECTEGRAQQSSELPRLTLTATRKRLCRPKTLPPTDLSAVRPRRSGSRLAINSRPDRNLRDDVRRGHPFLVAEVSGRWAKPAAMSCRNSGGPDV